MGALFFELDGSSSCNKAQVGDIDLKGRATYTDSRGTVPLPRYVAHEGKSGEGTGASIGPCVYLF